VGVSGKVDDAFDRVILQRTLDGSGVTQIALDQRTPFDGPGVTIDHIVECDRHIPREAQCLRGMTTDISRTAGHQNMLTHFSPFTAKAESLLSTYTQKLAPVLPQIPISLQPIAIYVTIKILFKAVRLPSHD